MVIDKPNSSCSFCYRSITFVSFLVLPLSPMIFQRFSIGLWSGLLIGHAITTVFSVLNDIYHFYSMKMKLNPGTGDAFGERMCSILCIAAFILPCKLMNGSTPAQEDIPLHQFTTKFNSLHFLHYTFGKQLLNFKLFFFSFFFFIQSQLKPIFLTEHFCPGAYTCLQSMLVLVEHVQIPVAYKWHNIVFKDTVIPNSFAIQWLLSCENCPPWSL